MTASHQPLQLFSHPTRSWLQQTFASPTRIQQLGWPVISAGHHTLLIAPTGCGKTLAAFAFALDRLAREPNDPAPGVRVLYVSPLKALVHDIERNLRAPLAGIERETSRDSASRTRPRVDVRTGDTTPAQRRSQAANPAEILVTTPESLFLILGAKARNTLTTVHTVIVDEVHALAGNKRGTHLALSLERLCALTEIEPQRIGLSATVRPIDAVARWLGGERNVEVVNTDERPRLDVAVTVPVPDMDRIALTNSEPGKPSPEHEGGIWGVLYPALYKAVCNHRATIIFVNSRGLCERLAERLNDLANEECALAHHGSISHQQRSAIEQRLKHADIRCIVATSSLELGIDMGAVDQVLLVESPGSVARALQRIGRAGHNVGDTSRGRIFPKFKADLLEAAVVAARMRDGDIEALRIPHNALDVLAQQIVAMVCDAECSADDVADLVRRAAPYRHLSRAVLDGVLHMLSGHRLSGEHSHIPARINWDRASDRLTARRGSALIARINAGTIADRGQYAVHLGDDGPRIGELDEEMVFETRVGDVVVLGASSWRVEAISRDRVIVNAAPGEPGRLPFWRGDGLGRDYQIGQAIGALTREVAARSRCKALQWLHAYAPLDALAAQNLVDYVHQQRAQCEVVPCDRDIVVERFRDELGDWRICVLTPFGARVHAPWVMALRKQFRDRFGIEVQSLYTDDGMAFRFGDHERQPATAEFFINPTQARSFATEELKQSALFAGLFREAASRALLLTRRAGNRRSPLWAQRQRAQSLLQALGSYRDFPIVLETYREAFAEHFDLPALSAILNGIETGSIRIHNIESARPSPFARALVHRWVESFIYDQDSPLAERRAQALTIDRALLEELLGEGELKGLIDAETLIQTHASLQGLAQRQPIQDADSLHDQLRRLSDLSMSEIALRINAANPSHALSNASAWCRKLIEQQRALDIVVDGEQRFIACEDAALFRDALGVDVPRTLPQSYLNPVPGALIGLAARFAARRGPFSSAEFASRYGISERLADGVLNHLLESSQLIRGIFRVDTSAPQWCDRGVFATLKRRTLARARRQIAAVSANCYAAFLAHWHHLGEGNATTLRSALSQLEGTPLPVSALESVILAQRVAHFDARDLDHLTASGEWIWVGCGKTGRHDGRIALYSRKRIGTLLTMASHDAQTHSLSASIIAFLSQNGASFSAEIEDAAKASVAQATPHTIRQALWELVWSGVITNDTLAPLRAHARRSSRRARLDDASAGRWSLVTRLVGTSVSDTECAIARAQLLLERFGIVARNMALAESVDGGFSALRDVFRGLEDRAHVRRGHFVDGLLGAQYALPRAVEQLRDVAQQIEDDENTRASCWLAALDPANPWGSLLPWPPLSEPQSRARRVPGAWVASVAGQPVLYLTPGARRVHTFAHVHGRYIEAALASLSQLPGHGARGGLRIETLDGEFASASRWRQLLAANGFVADYRAMVMERVV